MSIAITFDTLAVSNRLKANGFTVQQAEEITEVIKETRQQDLDSLVTRHDMAIMRAEILALEHRLKIFMGTLIIGLGGFLVALHYFK